MVMSVKNIWTYQVLFLFVSVVLVFPILEKDNCIVLLNSILFLTRPPLYVYIYIYGYAD